MSVLAVSLRYRRAQPHAPTSNCLVRAKPQHHVVHSNSIACLQQRHFCMSDDRLQAPIQSRSVPCRSVEADQNRLSATAPVQSAAEASNGPREYLCAIRHGTSEYTTRLVRRQRERYIRARRACADALLTTHRYSGSATCSVSGSLRSRGVTC